ncbi:MAG: response regulator [Lachnospiraceae bacterium]|nr:response regulator [Lachnospiraceae bacterium]
MEKILILGDYNQLVGSLNQHLSTRFTTQMCMDNLEYVEKIAKIYKFDMVVVCLRGVGELDKKVLDFFAGCRAKRPVLLIGTEEECKVYEKYYEEEQFECITRPTTLGMLQRKCEEMLDLVEDVEEETVVEEAPEQRKSILAVDDSGILLRSVKAMLEKAYDVMVANSGMAAIKQAKKKVPDLILLDYEMPEWDGKRTLEEIRNDEELKDIPVVFLTAVSDKSHIMAVLNLRPSGYLLKPIDQQVLLDTIEKALIKI